LSANFFKHKNDALLQSFENVAIEFNLTMPAHFVMTLAFLTPSANRHWLIYFLVRTTSYMYYR